MARAAKLKVYRTAIGFHDAYVAAPSRKAALEAWGSGKDLFARGAAEVVTDPALMEAPLASPGEVVRRLRGTAEEQMAALPAESPSRSRRQEDASKKTAAGGPVATPKTVKASPKSPPPPPSRSALEVADAALEEASRRAREEIADLDRREAALAAERRKKTADQAKENKRLERRRDAEAVRYDRAVARWRDR